MTRCRRRDASTEAGQALVEFALGITVFIMLMLGTLDLGRAAFQFNGVSEAAREIARVASVHPGSPVLGSTAEVSAVTSTQRTIVPGLTVTGFSCVDLAGTAVAGTCHPGNWVRVSVQAAFQPVFPLLAPFGSIVMTSSSSAEIQ